MVTGINQQVELLGRVFHVQTEVSADGPPVIRTAVFLGGRVVARRDKALDEPVEQIGTEVVRARMSEQHRAMVDSIVVRARRYQERQRRGEVPRRAVVPPAVTQIDEATLSRSVGADPDLDPELQRALRTRRLFARLRHRVEALARGEDLRSRLQSASAVVSSIVAFEGFGEIRVDEQVRFHLIKEQLESWLEKEGDSDADRGLRIWSDLVSFTLYLGEINNRTELVAFDRRWLRWAVAALEGGGSRRETVTCLRPLYGRDPELDELLDEPEDRLGEQWLDLLRAVLVRLEGGQGRGW